jgi:phosphopantothenoylcysteine decarboxylase/phosphopantothenate--cysteine ligase
MRNTANSSEALGDKKMRKIFQDKTVVLGVTGSIAAYKIANLASSLVKKGANVHVIMTKNATNFINPITFESLTGNKCLVDTFDRNFEFSVEHVSLAKMADVFMVAPASANVIGKIAGGIADDMLTTTIMACKCHKIISPAMNTNMFENQIVQDNIQKLMDMKLLSLPVDIWLVGILGQEKCQSLQCLKVIL